MERAQRMGDESRLTAGQREALRERVLKALRGRVVVVSKFETGDLGAGFNRAEEDVITTRMKREHRKVGETKYFEIWE